jgi:hypothetical protein
MKVLQIFVLTVFLSGLLFTITSADTIYTWKDKHGVTHITKEPPPKNARQVNSMDYKSEASFVPSPPPIDEQLPEDPKRSEELIEKTVVTEGTDTASDEQVYYDNDVNRQRHEQGKEERQQERLKKDERSEKREPHEPGDNSRQYYLEKRKQRQDSGNNTQSEPSANRSAGGRK